MVDSDIANTFRIYFFYFIISIIYVGYTYKFKLPIVPSRRRQLCRELNNIAIFVLEKKIKEILVKFFFVGHCQVKLKMIFNSN